MNLPFLKKRKTNHQPAPQPEKSVGLSPDEQLDDHTVEELMQAVQDRNTQQFKSAIEALVRNAFDYGDSDDE